MRQVLQKRAVPFAVLKSHVWVDEESTMSEVCSKIIPILGAARSDGGGNLGCEILLSTEEDDAEEILTSLVMECERKKEKGRKALDRVQDHLAAVGPGSGKSLVLVEEHLPNKTVGFCTAKISESLHKPVVIISMRGDKGVGEARGPKGVDLVDALTANKRFLLGYGGHKQAAGFSIERSKVDDFKAGFTDYLESKLDPSVIRREIRIDGKLAVGDLKLASLKALLCLEPFGEENRKPVFLLENLDASVLKEIDGTMRLGEVTLSGDTMPVDRTLDPGDKLSLVVSPFADGSVRSVEIVDWKKAK
jgi:single-stranded-DNA-specific exonuclease